MAHVTKGKSGLARGRCRVVPVHHRLHGRRAAGLVGAQRSHRAQGAPGRRGRCRAGDGGHGQRPLTGYGGDRRLHARRAGATFFKTKWLEISHQGVPSGQRTGNSADGPGLERPLLHLADPSGPLLHGAGGLGLVRPSVVGRVRRGVMSLQAGPANAGPSASYFMRSARISFG